MSKRTTPQTMSKLVNKDGSINLIEFKTATGIWRIIGTESIGQGLENCIDEMHNTDTREYVKRTRLQLKELEDKGYIKIN